MRSTHKARLTIGQSGYFVASCHQVLPRESDRRMVESTAITSPTDTSAQGRVKLRTLSRSPPGYLEWRRETVDVLAVALTPSYLWPT